MTEEITEEVYTDAKKLKETSEELIKAMGTLADLGFGNIEPFEESLNGTKKLKAACEIIMKKYEESKK